MEGETLYHVAGLKCCECGSYNTVRCGSETLPAVSSALLSRQRRGEWRYGRRRSRHREGMDYCTCSVIINFCPHKERTDLERQLQASEQKVSEMERKLAETRSQLEEYVQRALAAEQRLEATEERLVAAEHRRLEAEQRAAHAEQATKLVEKRAEMAEESVAELERKLFETETDLEELLEYREVVQATQIMSLESSPSQQELCHSSSGSLKILANSFIAHEHQAEVESLEQRQQCTSDKLSITSL